MGQFVVTQETRGGEHVLFAARGDDNTPMWTSALEGAFRFPTWGGADIDADARLDAGQFLRGYVIDIMEV